MIVEHLSADPRFLIVGAVRGLASEADAALAALVGFEPEVVGVALSPEEFEGLKTHFADAPAESVVPLIETEQSEIRGLVAFGEVRVPNPTYIRLIEWGRLAGIEVVPIDPPDEGQADLFTEHIGYLELVRRTLRERSITRHPPEARNADDFAMRWDQALSSGSGSRGLARARDEHFVREARELARGRTRVGLVLDRERAAQVGEQLAARASERTGV